LAVVAEAAERKRKPAWLPLGAVYLVSLTCSRRGQELLSTRYLSEFEESSESVINYV
jgi:hypothetical protein